MSLSRVAPGTFRPTRPAFEALLGSYARWKAEMDRVVPYPARAEDESFEDYARKHSLPPPPNSFVFIANLPRVAIADIAAEDRNCSICLDSFETIEDANSKEIPTRLPCGHIVGHRCLRRWVSPYGPGEVCPLCRAELLEDLGLDAEGEYATDDGQEIELDESVWADHEGGQMLSEAERYSLRVSRYCIVDHRLTPAVAELDEDSIILNRSPSGMEEPGAKDDGVCAPWRDTRARWDRRKQAIDSIIEEIIVAREQLLRENGVYSAWEEHCARSNEQGHADDANGQAGFWFRVGGTSVHGP